MEGEHEDGGDRVIVWSCRTDRRENITGRAGDKIIDQLNKKNVSSLDAFYICILVGVRSDSDPIPLYSVGEIHGRISTKNSGDGGFGYDKIFYPNGYDVSMASIDPEEKNKISHRAIAAQSFIKELEKL